MACLNQFYKWKDNMKDHKDYIHKKKNHGPGLFSIFYWKVLHQFFTKFDNWVFKKLKIDDKDLKP